MTTNLDLLLNAALRAEEMPCIDDTDNDSLGRAPSQNVADDEFFVPRLNTRPGATSQYRGVAKNGLKWKAYMISVRRGAGRSAMAD